MGLRAAGCGHWAKGSSKGHSDRQRVDFFRKEAIAITFPSRRFDQLAWTQAKLAAEEDGSTLIWPFGACEQHGPHLPLSTDSLFAERISEEVLKRLPQKFPIWSLPTQSIGFSPEHLSFPGTLSVSANVLLQLVMEIGEQLSSIGFKRLIFFNAHGGQIGLLEAAARQLRLKCPSMAVLPCFIWRGVDSLEDLIPQQEKQFGLHAALAETSLMMSLYPALVGDERPVDGDHSSKDSLLTPPEGWSLEGAAPYSWLTKDLSTSGVIGDSRHSNAILGNDLKNSLIEHWSKLFQGLMESDWPDLRGLEH